METITAYKLDDGTIIEDQAIATVKDKIVKMTALLESKQIKNYNYETLKCIAENATAIKAIL